jgi:hypothetical protein
MTEKLWKLTERKLAELLGGKRVPVHSTSECKSDIDHPCLGIEVKERKEVPSWLSDAVQQSVSNCQEDKLPIVILHQKGQRHDNDFVIMRLKDYCEWYVGYAPGGK